jgi:thymidine kinase
MWGGKTEALISRMTRAHLQEVTVAAFNPVHNNRAGVDRITSQSGAWFPAQTIETGQQILELSRDAEVVGIDEFFMIREAVTAVRELMRRKVKVVVATLDMDSDGLVWEPVSELLGLAQEVIKCPAVCAVCKHDAYYTFRRAKAPAGRLLVGATDYYEPRCFECWGRGQAEKSAASGPGSLFG